MVHSYYIMKVNLLRRYGEPLLDILVAGGVLAPGGGKVEGTAVSPVSVFSCEPMVEALRGHLVVRFWTYQLAPVVMCVYVYR